MASIKKFLDPPQGIMQELRWPRGRTARVNVQQALLKVCTHHHARMHILAPRTTPQQHTFHVIFFDEGMSNSKFLRQVLHRNINPFATPVIIDAQASRRRLNFAVGYSPCLTATRCANKGHWVSTTQAWMTCNDMLRLQGVRPARLAGWRTAVTERQLGHIAGNGVPVPLLGRILERLLPAAGLVSPGAAVWTSGPGTQRHGGGRGPP